MLEEPTLEEVKDQMDDLTLTFKDKGCCRSGFVGGKGAQLGLLTSIQHKVRRCELFIYYEISKKYKKKKACYLYDSCRYWLCNQFLHGWTYFFTSFHNQKKNKFKIILTRSGRDTV